MEVTAWNNGQHSRSGAGYGVKLTVPDRDRAFSREWKQIAIELESGKVIQVNVAKSSFWSETCRELIHNEIGKWLLSLGLAPWPKSKPPKLQLISTGYAQFKLCHRS